MSIRKEEKKKLVEQFGANKTDTGSPKVQVAILTAEIENLKNHLLEHKKDNHSRRGILQMVSKRRKLLSYLKTTNPEDYTEIIETLKLRK